MLQRGSQPHFMMIFVFDLSKNISLLLELIYLSQKYPSQVQMPAYMLLIL